MDREEYEQAVLQHKDRVHSHAVWMLHHREDARDVAQEALVRLWTNRYKVLPGTVGSWLLKTTHNLCIDRLRRRKSRPEVDPECLLMLEDDASPGPERSAHTSEVGRAISRALRSLSPRDRAIVLLREVQGFTYDEIATAVELPLGTLKSILHRARERMRRELIVAGVKP